jgi:hypothetical protein
MSLVAIGMAEVVGKGCFANPPYCMVNDDVLHGVARGFVYYSLNPPQSYTFLGGIL